jgi:hypothetical protein
MRLSRKPERTWTADRGAISRRQEDDIAGELRAMVTNVD